MKLGIVVNVMRGDSGGATTYRLAAAGISAGHEVWIMSTGNFVYEPTDAIAAFARSVPPGQYDSEQFLDALESDQAIGKMITLADLDLLFLRSNPAVQQGWAQGAGIHFGRLAMRQGVIVLNDPNGLSKAMNKLYLQTFPAAVRPRTLVTRHLGRLKRFLRDEEAIVLKPLQGYGGKGVFIVRRNETHNLRAIFDELCRDGYVIAQEYLPAAAQGDTRLFLMNGEPLLHEGRYAAFRRVRTGDDMRSNLHAGGRLRPAVVDSAMLKLADSVRARLVEDGMFLVGLDIAGDKLMEINVFSPGGFGSAQMFEKVAFGEAVLDALQRKVDYRRSQGSELGNVELATL